MLRLEEVDLGGKSLVGCEHDSYKGVKSFENYEVFLYLRKRDAMYSTPDEIL